MEGDRLGTLGARLVVRETVVVYGGGLGPFLSRRLSSRTTHVQ